MTETHESDRALRLGWRGIGVPVTAATKGAITDEAWLAVATDSGGGQPALSAWVGDGPYSARLAAIWMTPQGARDLALSLMALAERAEVGRAAFREGQR